VRLRARSFLLVDALVAAVMLGASLAIIMGLVSRAAKARADGERLEIAAMLLDEQLQFVLARGPDNYAQRFGLEGNCEAPFADYRYALDIGARSGEAYAVRATISWTQDGRTRSESIETRIAPRLGDEPDPERRPDETVVRE
jgi:hypothetical protein